MGYPQKHGVACDKKQESELRGDFGLSERREESKRVGRNLSHSYEKTYVKKPTYIFGQTLP